MARARWLAADRRQGCDGAPRQGAGSSCRLRRETDRGAQRVPLGPTRSGPKARRRAAIRGRPKVVRVRSVAKARGDLLGRHPEWGERQQPQGNERESSHRSSQPAKPVRPRSRFLARDCRRSAAPRWRRRRDDARVGRGWQSEGPIPAMSTSIAIQRLAAAPAIRFALRSSAHRLRSSAGKFRHVCDSGGLLLASHPLWITASHPRICDRMISMISIHFGPGFGLARELLCRGINAAHPSASSQDSR